jgi:pimeloyl-ACP methyl ester carboxylesterase
MTFVPTSTKYLVLQSGEKVFYRESGSIHSPTIVLFHGFPSSSHQFRNLIPILAPKYRVIAPDLPSYGFTSVPSSYKYNFENLAQTIDSFLEQIPHAPSKYSIYVFDYGAPTGFRIAAKHPERIQAIISQNGNAYDEGLGAWWDPLRELWASNSTESRDALRPFLKIEVTIGEYEGGTEDPSSIDPTSYTLDQALLDRPGIKEIQLDLAYDYQTNVVLYGEWQEYFRKSQVPLLAVWGKNDPVFIPAGAEAFRKDLPKAEVKLLNGGHFVEETNTAEIGNLMLEFLKKNNI